MRMVEESKNERLTMLLGKTNELLVRLGAAVQKQKDAEHTDGIEPLNDSEADDIPQPSFSKKGTPVDLIQNDDVDVIDSNSAANVKTRDLLEGQRQYNSVIHSIQEKVQNESRIFSFFVFSILQLYYHFTSCLVFLLFFIFYFPFNLILCGTQLQ